jgi:Sec-independent protein secretion pathway component TatC
MAGPLCILYELGIISARLFGRRTRKPAAVPETAAVAGPPPDSGGAP